MKRLALTPAALLITLSGKAIGQSADPFPARLQLATLQPSNGGDGSTGFILRGSSSDDFTGYSVSAVEDLNGDGIDDLVIGAHFADPYGRTAAGVSYVVFGAPGIGNPGVIDLASLDGTNGFAIHGIDAIDRSGYVVRSAGDVNGDGINDLLIGAFGADPSGRVEAGESYVIFGVAGLGASGSFALSLLDGTNGFTLNGIDPYDRSGISSSAAGDVNGDGFDDLIIASPRAGAFAGESYVVFGASDAGGSGSTELALLSGPNGFRIIGISPDDRSGVSVANAGDVNGDGIDDLILGAYVTSPNGSFSGQSYVIFGIDAATGRRFPPVFSLSLLDGSNGFLLNGVDITDLSGYSVAGVGDINGDGIEDLAIGAIGAAPNGRRGAGETYVVFGARRLGFRRVIELATLNGLSGFAIRGIDADDLSGYSVSRAGDVNGDGYDDLIIGAPHADPNGRTDAGESYVVFGDPDIGPGGEFNLSLLNGSNGFAINGIDAGDYSGRSVSGGADVNGDGIGDLIIGAFGAAPRGNPRAGEGYVVFGRNLAPVSPCLGDANADRTVNFDDIVSVLGNWQADYAPGTGPGDANLDGLVDFNDVAASLTNWLQVCP